MKTNQMVEIKDSRKKQIGGARAKMIPNVGREGSCEIFLHRDWDVIGREHHSAAPQLSCQRKSKHNTQMCADTLNKQCTNVERWLVGWAIERCRTVRPSINQKSWEPPRANFLQHTAAFRSRNVFLQITMIKPKRNHQYTFLPRQFSSFLLFSNQYARGSNKSVDPWINCVEAHSHGGIDYKGPAGCWSWKNIYVITITTEQQPKNIKM